MKPANFTRRTTDLVGKFAHEGRYHFIALYYLLRLSDLAREGIEHSGSYLFADHLYRNQASGRGFAGRWLDRCLLNLPASRAMRSRCGRARDEMRRAFDAHLEAGNPGPFRILTVPCGIPRDVREFAAQITEENGEILNRIEYTGQDLDAKVVESARKFLGRSSLPAVDVIQANALEPTSYKPQYYHFIASTGLGEFLDDDSLAVLYRNVFDSLAPGGVFFTSATEHEKRSEALLRAFELETRYRTRADLERVLAGRSWKSVEFDGHPSRLQTFVLATKG